MKRKKISVALALSLLTGLFALQAPVAPVAAVNGVSAGWSPVGGGLPVLTSEKVFALALDSDGHLYAGGSFTGGLARVSLSAGTNWSAFGGGVGGDGTNLAHVYSLGLDASSNPKQLYVGGAFSKYGPTTSGSPKIAKITVPAGTWSGVGSGVASTIYNWDGVEEISVISSSRIFFGGSPALASAVSGTEGLVKWDGTTVSAVSGGFGGDKRVNALAQFGGELYVGGQFDSVNGGTVSGSAIARFNPTTSAWTSLGGSTSGPGTSGLVAAIAVKDASNVFVGGIFNTVSNSGSPVLNTKHLAKWDGNNWTSIGSVTGTAVEELRVIGNYLYAGGEFTAIGGVAANNIARMDLSTNTWEALIHTCFNGVNGVVRSIIDANDGNDSVYVGGGFKDAGGFANTDLVAKWTPGATAPCPSNTEVREVPALDAPKRFRWVSSFFEGQIPNYNNGEKGRLLSFQWDAPVGVSYYIYRVSTERIVEYAAGGNTVPARTEPVAGLDCWSSGLTCDMVIPFGDPSWGANGYIFKLQGFTFDGVGKSASLRPPSPYDPVFPPSAPRNVRSVGGWNKITVTYDVPADEGTYPITNYLVTSVPDRRSCITTLMDANILQCTFTSLTPGTNYTFTVQALNGGGWGEQGAVMTPVAARNLKITSYSRKKVNFLVGLFGGGSDLAVGATAPGYTPGAQMTAWYKIGDGNWTKGPVLKVERNGNVNLKQRLPKRDNRTPLLVRFQDAEGNYSNTVLISALR